MNREPALLPGRESELALLRDYFDRAVAGDQQLVLIEGDPGVGKTALLEAFARTHRRRLLRGPRIFLLQAPDDAERYQPVHHAALAATSQRLYRKLGGKKQATETGRSLLMEWLGVVPIWGDLLEAIAGTLDVLQRRRRARRFAELDTLDEDIEALLAASRRRPLVLLLDQLERADGEAVARLSALIEQADGGAHILIVGAYRPTAPGVPHPPVHSLRRTLPHKGEFFRHLRLGGLRADAVARWMAERFGPTRVPVDFLRWLVGATGGHPGTIEETLDHLLNSGALRWTGKQWQFEVHPDRLELPEIGASFADLSAVNPYIAEVVRSAALLGDEFDAFTLSRLLERDELAVEDQLALGVHYGLLENLGERELPDGEPTTGFRFPDAHLRAALLRRLDPALRATLTARLAILRAAESPATVPPHPAPSIPH